MASSDYNHVKVPLWLATLMASLILGVCADSWRTIYQVKTDLRLLKTALAVKGVIDLSVCNASKLTHFTPDRENPGFQEANFSVKIFCKKDVDNLATSD